jgi:apolipoprotein N-acyltransferase
MMGRTTPRYTALWQGVMAEVAMGGTLLVWLGSSVSAGRAPFGPAASIAVLIVAMVGLAAAMLALVLATRLARAVLRTCVVFVSLSLAGLGALVVGALLNDPDGLFFLLAGAWVFGVWSVVTAKRANGEKT